MNSDTVMKLVMGAGLLAMAGLVVAYLTGHLKGDDRAQKHAESLAAMNTRSIVADFIRRGDFLHLSDQGFAEWLEANEGFVFPHERETMEKQRAAQSDVMPHRRRN